MEVDFNAKTANVTASGDFDQAICEKALKKAGYGLATFEEIAKK